ncbi:MAG: LuxR C-terminal-related transcriptional regulator [Candidatus Didemnitutus sp.]|jgi:DNA-binding NarL/FixJ family response regulator|nr:LuxR C-terminal-related transcriptional regulator [Candidatus Didemnitutus sp.]
MARSPRNARPAPPAVVKLTPAEAKVVAEAARGSGNREIAAVLGKSMSTVKAQLSGVYRKLRIKNRLQLIMLFRS